MKTTILIYILIFILGWLCSVSSTNYYFVKEFPYFSNNTELASPSNHIKNTDILISQGKILLDIENPILSIFADTNSMDPLIDEGAIGIEIIPKSESDLNIGDIVAFESNNELIIHRIVHINKDEKGTYYITKGDNNSYLDLGKLRFNQIKYLLIGVLY